VADRLRVREIDDDEGRRLVRIMRRGLVAVDRNEHALREPPDGVGREVADTTDPAAAKSFIGRIAGEVGPPDVLVNTIGAFRPGDALTTTPETLRLMINVNLGPALWLSQAVAPHIQWQGSGAIVHVTARPGIEPSSGMAAYSASKAALVHLTRILDVELRPHGIRVNAVAPQLLDTPRQPGHVPGRGDGARGRAGDDRQPDRIPCQRRCRAGQRSDTPRVRRLTKLIRRDARRVRTFPLTSIRPPAAAAAAEAVRCRAGSGTCASYCSTCGRRSKRRSARVRRPAQPRRGGVDRVRPPG